jgi:beta-lactamase superfamily II metal-dependent hydrolase
MLTGDLELTRRTWTRFYEHYFLEWEDIKVINVPHHGSSRALHDDVIQQLREGMFLLFPVKKNDKSHPSKMLTDQLDKLRRCTQQNVTEDTDAGFTLSTAWRVENGYQ